MRLIRFLKSVLYCLTNADTLPPHHEKLQKDRQTMISKSLALLALTTASQVAAQSSFTLAAQTYTYTALPYQVDTSDGERGPQFGYNICNSTVRLPLACFLATYKLPKNDITDPEPTVSLPDGNY
jgi:hypothetical protein